MNVVEISDSLDFLIGGWEVRRVIEDHRNALRGCFVGTARLSPDPSSTREGILGGATYEEQGELELGDHVGPAARRLEYRRGANGSVLLYLSHGSHFVDLDLATGTCERQHRCAPDTYDIKIEVHSSHRYVEYWRVTGPRKDYEATATYSRLREPPWGQTLDPS